MTLLVGEGDFTFARALCLVLGGSNIVATAFDSKAEMCEKYPDAGPVVDSLLSSGVRVRHSVDATRLNDNDWLRAQAPTGYSRIVFNFPHIGGATVEDVEANRALVKDFFASSRSLLLPTGSVIVSLRSTPFYDSWGIADLAASVGFKRSGAPVKFDAADFPGYAPVRTNPAALRQAPEVDNAFLHVFTLAGDAPAPRAAPPPPKAAPLPSAPPSTTPAPFVVKAAKTAAAPLAKKRPAAVVEAAPPPVMTGTYCNLCKEECGTAVRVGIHLASPWHKRKEAKAVPTSATTPPARAKQATVQGLAAADVDAIATFSDALRKKKKT